MRLSEKSIELTFAAQARMVPWPPVWFGLTQAQEARFGFDAATQVGGRVMLLQFKASSKVVRAGRQFRLPHPQLLNLQSLAGSARRAVFYAFPDVGSTAELRRVGWDLLAHTWLLDVAALPAPFPARMTRSGSPGDHNAYLRPPFVTIRSEPVEAGVEQAGDILQDETTGVAPGEVSSFLDAPAGRLQLFTGAAVGLVLPPRRG